MTKKLVFILPDECRQASPNVKNPSVSAEHLINPRDGSRSLYLFDATKTKVYEVNKFTEPYQTWLHKGATIPKGDLHIVTPVDPLFLLLPHVSKNAKFFAPLDQSVKNYEFPATSWLVNCVQAQDVEKICDRKSAGGHEVYRYNEQKTMEWLEAKARRLAAGLKAKALLGARSANFVQASRTKKSTKNDDDLYIAESVGIICDYLEPHFAVELKNRLGIAVETVPDVEDDENVEPAAKKLKVGEPEEDYSVGFKVEKVKEVKKSITQKKLAVAAKGTKSITAFFGKPKSK